MSKHSKLGYAGAFVVATSCLLAFSYAFYDMLLGVELNLSGTFVQLSMLALLTFLLLLIGRYFVLLWFSYLAHLEEKPDTGRRGFAPMITILVPAYNEGAVIQASLRSLLELDYPSYEILVIDDGSSDDTYRKARVFEGTHGRARVRVIRKVNGGKSRALNTGIAAASGDFVLCMDGDSALHPLTLRRAIRHLADPSVAAVAGNVKVVNRSNFWSRLQALEYIEGLNMVRKAQGFFRTVNIIPGPIGVFRRSALEELGGYDHDTFAEDCDLTLKLIALGWQICYEPGAIAYTEAPEALLDLLKQRYRWTRGILQAIRKHRRAFLLPYRSPRLGLTLWYMIFEGILWPVMNVFGHVLFAFVAVRHGAAMPLVLWFGQLTVLDLAAALYCVAVEEEEMMLVPYAIAYRAFFALLIDVAKLMASFEEVFGVRMEWGKLDRMGRI